MSGGRYGCWDIVGVGGKLCGVIRCCTVDSFVLFFLILNITTTLYRMCLSSGQGINNLLDI